MPTSDTAPVGLAGAAAPAEVAGTEIEAASDEAESRPRRRYPEIRYVFLDPTRGTAGRNHRDGGTDL